MKAVCSFETSVITNPATQGNNPQTWILSMKTAACTNYGCDALGEGTGVVPACGAYDKVKLAWRRDWMQICKRRDSNECISTTVPPGCDVVKSGTHAAKFLSNIPLPSFQYFTRRRRHQFPPKHWHQSDISIQLADGRNRWRAFVNTLMNVRVPFEAGRLEISWQTISVSIAVYGSDLRTC
jgi:hypothetical protein